MSAEWVFNGAYDHVLDALRADQSAVLELLDERTRADINLMVRPWDGLRLQAVFEAQARLLDLLGRGDT